jgi:hypothetical protein
MRYLLWLGLFITGWGLTGQQYTDPENRWIYRQGDTFQPPPHEYNEGFGFGDTLSVNGRIYRRLYYTNEDLELTTPTGVAFAQEEGRIYRYQPMDGEVLVFDEQLAVGDTCFCRNTEMVVTAIDTLTLLDGSRRPRWQLQSDLLNEYWIGGIGDPLVGPLSQEIWILAWYPVGVQCYYLGEQLLWEPGEYCTLNHVVEGTISSSWRVVPNPVRAEGRLFSDAPLRSRLFLYAADGRIRRTYAPAGARTWPLELTGLPAGPYWLVEESSGRRLLLWYQP